MVMLNVGWWNKKSGRGIALPRADQRISRVRFFGMLVWELFVIEHDYIFDGEESELEFRQWAMIILPRLTNRIWAKVNHEAGEKLFSKAS